VVWFVTYASPKSIDRLRNLDQKPSEQATGRNRHAQPQLTLPTERAAQLAAWQRDARLAEARLGDMREAEVQAHGFMVALAFAEMYLSTV
jgi:hypothetical protein